MYQQCCASKYFELHAPVQVTFLAKIEHCMLMRLMSKGEYVIVPKGTKFAGAGKLGLKTIAIMTSQTRP